MDAQTNTRASCEKLSSARMQNTQASPVPNEETKLMRSATKTLAMTCNKPDLL
jgi:hypothetical protein